MRGSGRMPMEGRNGVLVKTMKPGQDVRADLPAIGPRTVEAVAEAGLAACAWKPAIPSSCEREKTIEAAREAGIYLYGVDARSLAAMADAGQSSRPAR